LNMAQETAEALENEETEEMEAPPEIDSKYRLILLAAQRSKQLQRGALPRVDVDTRKHKATRVAMKEIEEGKVNFKILEN
jgi:DNA-directed RNA polymerase omega subunit